MMGSLLRDRTDVALALVCGVLREGGATVSPRVNDTVPATGYFVGGAREPYVVEAADLRPADLVAWLERTDVPAGAYVGAWRGGDDGQGDAHRRLYFDVSDHWFTPEIALAEAAERHELAIWDIASGREIHNMREVA